MAPGQSCPVWADRLLLHRRPAFRAGLPSLQSNCRPPRLMVQAM
jgi:hypothetical protein